ncbi:hypothetical protein JF544_01960 [Halobacillus kuroshimensis]|uniref:DUF4362 domain-containing protein n=1 Tax=Halobacillus kuroshimensis TaxID=302481 RepID=A0ABS3DRN1_9BACI|nr:hypothetical protein [Halobacillus kuroshimensis]MBN8233986.1 hypothetical protein [Halobacillus kuroshimensis]
MVVTEVNRKLGFLVISLSIALLLQGCGIGNGNSAHVDTAVQKVSQLYETNDSKKVKQGEVSKIKPSTDQEMIKEALEAIDKIDKGESGTDKNAIVAFALRSSVQNAQIQLNEREGTSKSLDNYSGGGALENEYQPRKKDVVLKDNQLKNKNILEEFMNSAGGENKNNDSEIRVIKDEGYKGVLIYDLEANYDESAGQSWISVKPDFSYYSASENRIQDVFNTRQQCGYMSKDEQKGFYILNDCRTHSAYRFLPIANGDG